MNWQFFAIMAAGMIRSAGTQKQMEDENTSGKDDLLGNGLVFLADALVWFASGMPSNKKPTVPDVLK